MLHIHTVCHRVWKSVAGLLICLLLIAGALPIAAAEPAADNPARPRIGLVLAGGGAKGGAHVGVLKVLEELHVPIDCIAGTSIGALVGAGYASGIPAEELEHFVTGIDWRTVVGGLGMRDLEPIEQKRAGVTYSNNLEMGIKGGTVLLPGGIANTSAIEDLLRSFVAKSRMEANFDQLPIPFRAVATDMVTGNMVVLKDGDIATAMRASMAIPGAFAPVITRDYVLSDGGMVRNIPVDVARELCADVVIVVNLVEPTVGPEQLHSAAQLLARSMDVMIEANEELQLQSLSASDIRIDVEMGGIGTADFQAIPQAIPLGETAARSLAGELSSLALPPAQYAIWRKSVTADQEIEAQLAAVRFEGLERVNPEFLALRAQVHAGDTVDTAAISAEAKRMSALREFESVEYRLEGDPKNPTLVWLPREKRIGPNYLKFDLGMYASGDGDLAFVIAGKHTRTWINSLGAEWRNLVQIGYDSLITTSFYQPLDVAQKYFIEPATGWTRTQEDLFSDGERLASYFFDDYYAGVDLGANLGNHAQARAGYLYTYRDIELETGTNRLPEETVTDAGLSLSATYDSRDTAFGPTSGMAFAMEFLQSNDSLGADRDWERLELGFGAAVPVRKDVIWLTLAGGSNLGSDLPFDRYFKIGGPGSFPGYQLGEVRTEEYWTASGSYLWQFAEIQPLRGQALYAGVRLQAGEFPNRIDDVDEGLTYGGSVYLTGRTPVGPLTLGWGVTSTNTSSFWVTVGRPIGQGIILERGIFR